MTDKELQLIKSEYNKIMCEKNELEQLKKRVLELKEDPIVNEYIELINILMQKSNIDFNEKIYSSFSDILKDTKKSNNILFDYGVQKVYTGEDTCFLQPIIVNRHIYIDLETGEIYCKFHEKLYSIDPMWQICCYYDSETQERYKQLRKYFFEQILVRDQENVIEEMLKNNKELIKGKLK